MKPTTLADLFRYTPEGIVASERAGGAAMAHDEKLPRQALEHREKLEALGFEFGEEVGPNSTDGDRGPMFVACKLPKGWEKKQDPDDPYGRGVYLYDDKGRKRASIFVKLAGYDNYCSIGFGRRYEAKALQCDSAGAVVGYSGNPTHEQWAVTREGEVLERVGRLIPRPNWREDREEAQRLTEEGDATLDWATRRLKELYPEADDPFAYWD